MKNSKCAFTLAEVLITLGIIGIVAALTLPSLIENHNKKVWVTALQKFYSTQQQGFQKMLVDEGAEKLEDTSVFQSIGPTSTSTMDFCQPGQSGNASCKMFFDNLKKYFQFNIITTASSPETYIYDLNGNIEDSYSGYSRVIALADGSFILSGSTFYKSELKGSETRA